MPNARRLRGDRAIRASEARRRAPAGDRDDRARDGGRPRALPRRRAWTTTSPSRCGRRSSTPCSSAGSALGAAPLAAPAEPAEAAVEALVDEARMRTFRDDYPDIVDQLVDLFVGEHAAAARRAARRGRRRRRRRSCAARPTSSRAAARTSARRSWRRCAAARDRRAATLRDDASPSLDAALAPDRGRDPPRADGGAERAPRSRSPWSPPAASCTPARAPRRATAGDGRARPLRGARRPPARRVGDALRPRPALHAARGLGAGGARLAPRRDRGAA